MREALGDRALAQLRRATKQQAVAQSAGADRSLGLIVDTALPRREYGAHRVASVVAASNTCNRATACAATTSAGWLASITSKRSGSVAARSR
jgi:hypothetical protein